MTQDEILDALYKVVQENKHYTTWTVSTPHLVALVKLAIEHEREACAQFIETGYVRQFENPWRDDLSAAIRARGQA